MYSVRIKFTKMGTAAYISHLDLMQTIQRSLVRTGLPVKYSQGFNPHIYLSILSPISTGFESEYELCDFDLTTDTPPEDLLEQLNRGLPQGIQALEHYQSTAPIKDIKYAVYEISYAGQNAQELKAAMEQDIVITKESKRQSKEVTVQDYIKNITFEQRGDSGVCTCVLTLGDDTLNPKYISAALVQVGAVPQELTPRYKKIGLLDKNFQNFK